jgi:hypothetical protein
LPTYVPPIGGVARSVHDLRAAEDAREREAGGDRLRDAHQVGLDVVVLDAPELPRAAVAGLDLVDDEDDAVVVAELAHAGEKLGRRDDEASLALNGLDHDGRDALGGTCVTSARSRAARASPELGPR